MVFSHTSHMVETSPAPGLRGESLGFKSPTMETRARLSGTGYTASRQRNRPVSEMHFESVAGFSESGVSAGPQITVEREERPSNGCPVARH